MTGMTTSLAGLRRPSQWLQPGGRGVVGWSIVYSLSLCVILLLIAGLIDLCVHRGEVDIEPPDVNEARKLGGASLLIVPAGEKSRIVDSGVFPTIWQLRETIWGQPLSRLYRGFPPLRAVEPALSLYILQIACIGWLCGYSLGGISTGSLTIAQRISHSLREAIHRQALRLGVSDVEGKGRELAWKLFTHDVDQIHDTVRYQTEGWWRHGLSAVSLLLLSLIVDWRLTFYCLVPLLTAVALWHYERRRELAAQLMTEAETAVDLRLLSEGFHHPQLIKGFGMEQFEHERFRKHGHRLSDRRITGYRNAAGTRRLSRFLSIGFIAIAIYLAALRILSPDNPADGISLAKGLLCVFSLAVVAPSLSALWQLYVDRDALSRLHAGVKRYLSEIPEVGQAVGARFIEPVSKSIAVEGVTYTYQSRAVLEKLDLTISAHSTIAIISPESVTARVFAQLLPRFIEPQVGRILFDNQDIAFGTLESLRAETGYISGRDSVLTGTIIENLTCGDSAISLPDATEAAKKSHAHNFIQRLPQGYETVVGERGVTLDSGECFRLAIARALLRDPAVLIIEEPEIALDDDTKSLIDDSYARLCPGRTVIFLPTRLSTIKRCSRVVLLREGSIVADGKHADLVRNSEEYRHWEYTQFNVFQRRT